MYSFRFLFSKCRRCWISYIFYIILSCKIGSQSYNNDSLKKPIAMQRYKIYFRQYKGLLFADSDVVWRNSNTSICINIIFANKKHSKKRRNRHNSWSSRKQYIFNSGYVISKTDRNTFRVNKSFYIWIQRIWWYIHNFNILLFFEINGLKSYLCI